MSQSIENLMSLGRADLGGDDEAARDARVLLCATLGWTRAQLYAHPQAQVPAADADRVRAALARRARGEPVAHILGRREFWGLDLRVTAATLIPRPATETLVACTLAVLGERPRPRIADLGTGSGAIALALASERPDAQIVACDSCPDALAVAHDNARRLSIGNVRVVQGDWFEALAGAAPFDAIASNPPYVALGDPHLSEGDVRFEPPGALVAGADGLDALRHLTQNAPAHLAPGGWLLVEHGYDQADAVRALFEQAGFEDIKATRDLDGHERAVQGRLA